MEFKRLLFPHSDDCEGVSTESQETVVTVYDCGIELAPPLTSSHTVGAGEGMVPALYHSHTVTKETDAAKLNCYVTSLISKTGETPRPLHHVMYTFKKGRNSSMSPFLRPNNELNYRTIYYNGMSTRTQTPKSSKCASPALQTRESQTITTSAKSNGFRAMTTETQASGRCSRSSGLKIQDADGEVYALIRFKNEHTQSMRNACVKHKRVVGNYAYGGEIIGIADKVQPVYGDLNGTNSRCGLVMIKFPSKEKAKNWFQSDPLFRQGDFPRPSGEIGLAVIPLHYIPPRSDQDSEGLRTFEMIEICNIADNCRLQTEYVDKMAALMDKHHLCHGVVATSDSSSPKLTWLHPDNYIVLNEYKDCDEFNKFKTNDEYLRITDAGRGLCRMNSILFTVDPRIAK